MTPTTIDEFIGNEKVKQQIQFIIDMAVSDGKQIPHTMFAGNPSAGKTTMANLLAKEANETYLGKLKPEIKNVCSQNYEEEVDRNDWFIPKDLRDKTVLQILKEDERVREMHSHILDPLIVKTSGRAIKNSNDVRKLVRRLFEMNEDSIFEPCSTFSTVLSNRPKFLYIDEVHGLSNRAQDAMLLLLEEFTVETDDEQIKVPKFTCIASTTDPGKLVNALKTRFVHKINFVDYKMEELELMVKQIVEKAELEIDNAAAKSLASRCKGIPRQLVNHTKMVISSVRKDDKKKIGKGDVEKYFDLFNIDLMGLKLEEDILVLLTLYENKGKAIGLSNISQVTYIDERQIQETIEPFLLKKGFIERTGNGRKITKKGVKYLTSNKYADRDTSELNPFA